ncbi:hypothetical protein, variant [Capsaspora owczarzaki ATCC 30864]|uniref:GPI-anchored wall transfer protein 1 n=1 Tax=Capsaspora owczarzaki (strain ATCC 30864) TaxID=595528 RepID=A0A0D2VLP3_CAPO3|nr:hypothetical protein, variant [Capsaspora owczarzaki ATCC 30864]
MISDKDRHEAFVSGHVGSNEWHIQLTVLAAQLGPILFSCARATFAASRALATPSRRKRESGNGTKPEECAATFPADFACVVLPMLLAFTLPDQVPALVFAEVCALAILVAIGSFRPYSPQPLRQRATPKSAPTVPAPETTATRKPQSSVIAAYRAMAMVSIVFVILAVDFRVFPRHHAKTETFGTSMMDAGVGSLAFSAGLASKPPNSLAAVVPRTIPLLILGALRTLAVKATDYHEHVSEYGVHWNFFLTLAGILLLDGLFTRLLARTPSLFKDNARPWMGWWLAGVFLAFAHEVLLKGFGLLDFVLHADRSSSWIAANKEGVISLMGYLGLFFLGRAHGAGIHLREASRGLALFRAAGCIALLATIYAILPGVCGLDPPSRRVVRNLRPSDPSLQRDMVCAHRRYSVNFHGCHLGECILHLLGRPVQ